VKPEPEKKMASAIQKEISKLRAQLDQKHIDHMIQMKKIDPSVGQGHAKGGGYGNGYGPGNCGRQF
jgi:hypothetical protein